VLDPIADAGPLAGLLAGLEAARTEWVAVLACDMPRASAGALRELLAEARRSDLDLCLADLPRGSQPMLAVYRRRCAPAVRAALEAGQRRMVAFHALAVDGRPLRAGTLALADAGAALNLNTPADLAAEIAREGGAP
jgi:molybdopterin-guanine dinucleotide biosynthesis protein A